MATRTIRTGIGTYRRADGEWSFGMFGDEVDVHKSDVDRFDRLNPEEIVEPIDDSGGSAGGDDSEFPEGEPSEEWTAKQLDAYAADKSIDLGAAKTKPEKVSAIAAAAASA